ncbi:hypothetical protein C3L33_17993, partial [Rhododendron williamsianum]
MAAAVGNLIRKMQHFSSTHDDPNHHDIVFHLVQIQIELHRLQPNLADAEWKRDVHESRRKTVTHGEKISRWVSTVAVLAAEVEDIILTCDLHLLNMNIGDSTFSELLHYWLFATNDNLTAKIHVFLSRFPQLRTTPVNESRSPQMRETMLFSLENQLEELLFSKIGFVLRVVHEAFVTSWPYRLFWMDFVQLWAQFAERVKEEIAKLNREAFSLQLTGHVEASPPRPVQASRKAILGSIGMLGRTEELKRLEGWLLATEEVDSLTPVVIAVNGEVGIGKTSIAKVIYESLQKHFDCHAWIFVSQNRTRLLLDILRGLLKSLSVAASGNIDAIDEATMKREIRLVLTGKKFLLVLDEIPTQQELEYVKEILPSGCQAKILLTSRSHISGCTHVLALRKLSPQDSFHLFDKRAFLESQNNTFRPSIMVEGKEILETCEGFPLAIATIGGMLSTKQMDAKEWSKVHNMLKEADFISLSYADLHPVLKSCFLYAASFPYQYEIPCKKLKRLWIAEGFVKKRVRTTVEEAASLQLDELIQRNLIQVARVGKDGEVETCRILGPMRVFGVRRSEQDLVSVVHSLGSRAMPERTRRLFLQAERSSSNNNMIAVEKPKLSGLCSLLAFEESKNQIPFKIPASSFKLLCVLELQQVPDDTLPKAVGDLVLLHYLGLRRTRLKELPISLKNLGRLQTLDIRDTSVRDLPPGLEVLNMLKHLLLAGSFSNEVVSVETKIEVLKHLLTLAGVKLTEDIAEQLQHLSQLQKLSVGEVRSNHSKSLSKSIDKMEYLGSLTIKCFPGEKIQILSSTPLDCLEKLRVGGQVENLLDWVRKKNSLKYLYMWDCMLTEDPLSALKDLPNLVVLSLCNAYEGEQIQVDAIGFPKLKKLSILRCKMLKRWTTIKEGALKELETLTIAYCPNLTVLPIGLEKLKSLTSFETTEMPETFIKEARELHSSLPKSSILIRDTSQLFPIRPTPKRFPMSMPVNQMWNPSYLSKREM